MAKIMEVMAILPRTTVANACKHFCLRTEAVVKANCFIAFLLKKSKRGQNTAATLYIILCTIFRWKDFAIFHFLCLFMEFKLYRKNIPQTYLIVSFGFPHLFLSSWVRRGSVFRSWNKSGPENPFIGYPKLQDL
jgi:hypothetical protein